MKGFVSELGFKKEILKINNGVEITEIQKETLDKPEINLIIVSRLVIQKNIDLVINALKILNNVNLKLNIIGEGNEISKLEKVINDFNLHKQVKLLGKIDNNEISKFLSNSDIFIQASDYEGLPHSVLEAINYEVPILSTEAGGCKDLLNDGERGFIISSPPNKNLIAKNIKFIINNKDEAIKRAAVAKSYISKEYNFSSQAKVYMEVIQKTVEMEL